MKHNKQRGSSGALGFCLISIYFFIGLIFYFALFFMRIGSNPSWIELFFLIYGLFGLVFIMPYIIGMLGRILVFKCQDDGCEYSYYDDDEDEEDEQEECINIKEVNSKLKAGTSSKKAKTRKENKNEQKK